MYKADFLSISTVVFAIVSFSFAAAFGAAEPKAPPRRPQTIQEIRQAINNNLRNRSSSRTVPEDTADEKKEMAAPATEGKPADVEEPNESAEFRSLAQQGQNEMREWIHGTEGDRIALAGTVQSQITAELNYIRRVAEKEGATETTEAIDKVLAERKQRLERVTKRIREERSRMRQGQQRGVGENIGRGRSRTQPGRAPRGRNQAENGRGTRSRGRMPEQNNY